MMAPDPTTHRARSPHPAWRLGLVTDQLGHAHLCATIAATGTSRPEYVNLLAAVGAASITEGDLDRLVVLAQGEHIADLRRLVERCIYDARLRDRLVELIELSTSWN